MSLEKATRATDTNRSFCYLEQYYKNSSVISRFHAGMAVSKRKLVFFTTVVGAMLLFKSPAFAEIMCPELVAIEKGGSKTVTCDTMEKDIANIFWYTGDPATTNPILRLQNGKPGGTEYGRGHYNISSSGAMIIKNATIKQEALYNALVYFSDGTSESVVIQVNITVSPQISCPAIDSCVPCEKCRLAVNGSGKLVCRITEARPRIHLKWIMESKTGVSLVEHSPVLVREMSSDNWNTSAEISYDISSCNQRANVQCVALDDFHRLQQTKASVEIFSEKCVDERPNTTPSNNTTGLKIIIAIAGIFICVVLTIILFTFIYINRRRRRNSYRYEPAEIADLNMGTRKPLKEYFSSDVKQVKVEVEKLVSDLKTKYGGSRFSELLRSWKSMEFTDDIVACLCEVKHTKGDSYYTSTKNLLSSVMIRNEKRVLITAKSNHVIKMFASQFVHHWIENNESDFILLYITKEELEANESLFGTFESQISVDSSTFAKCIKSKKCILFLDGTRDITLRDKTTANKFSKGEPKNEKMKSKEQFNDHLILLNLFKDLNERDMSTISIWIASCACHNWTSPHASVHVGSVSEQCIDDFVGKICETFSNSLGPKRPAMNISGTSEEAPETEFKSDHEKKQEIGNPSVQERNSTEDQPLVADKKHSNSLNKDLTIQNALNERVKEFLKRHNLHQEFRDLPLLLSIMIYSAADMYGTDTSYPGYLEFSAKEKLIGDAITRLKKYFQGHEPSNYNRHISRFDLNLGKLALGLLNEQVSSAEKEESILEEWNEDINFAVELGILRQEREEFSRKKRRNAEDESSKALTCEDVEFSHKLFQYYFAAIFTVKKKTYSPTLLKTKDRFGSYPILNFLTFMEDSSLKHLCETYWEFVMHDVIIDCLHLRSNVDRNYDVVEEISKRDVKITCLDNLKHRDAFASFCKKCIDMKITVKSLSINSIFSMSFMTALQIPDIEVVSILEMELYENEFFRIVMWLSSKVKCLRFLKCKIPITFSDEYKDVMKSLENSVLKRILLVDKRDNQFSLNYKKLQWTKDNA